MRRKTTVIVALTVAFGLAQANQEMDQISCLPIERLGCGCSLAIKQFKCAGDKSQYQFFSELFDGAPLHVGLHGLQVKLNSTRADSDPSAFSFNHGDSWSENYTGRGVSVKIDYRPGKDSCPKKKIDTACEYFDVDATVEITQESITTQYETTGLCGC